MRNTDLLIVGLFVALMIVKIVQTVRSAQLGRQYRKAVQRFNRMEGEK